MHNITKKLLFVLLTIMAYLPMTVVHAMPDVTSPIQANITMDMSAMDISICHHQQVDKTCDSCDTKHNCHCVHSSCSVSVGITAHYCVLTTHRKLKDYSKGLQISTLFQQPSRLFRPPIFL
jgi:hypothetical protein